MKPDLIVTWHESCDYPLARKTLIQQQDFFGKIIIYFSQHFRYPLFSHFIHEQLKDIKNIVFLDPIQYELGVQDWRNIATNEMLKYSESEWVCSIEQDWFSQDWEQLLDICTTSMKTEDMFGWMNITAHSYIHPAFWFIKRELLDKTSKDFGPHSEIVGADHFAQITYDVQALGVNICPLPVGQIDSQSLAFHLGGVNNAYLDGINTNIFHRPEIFYIYNHFSMKQPNIHPIFMEKMQKVDLLLKERFPTPETSPWKVFFQ